MTHSDLKSWAALPVCCEVRRTALAAGAVTALLTGGLPFVGFEPGLIMGRASLLPSVLSFALHLALAVVYGAVFCLAISRTRDGATLLSAGLMTIATYAANYAATHAWSLPRPLPETDAIIAHLVFGASFTVLFKLAEIGVPDGHPISTGKPETPPDTWVRRVSDSGGKLAER